MLLNFPSMHPEFAGVDDITRVRYLDPGLDGPIAERYFRPEGLPLNPKAAMAFVEESLRFGEQFGSAKDLAYFASGCIENFFDQTSMAIRTELRSRLEGREAPRETAARARAQGMLLLGHSLEQRTLEAIRHQNGARDGHLKLAEALGFSEEDREDLREFGLGREDDEPLEPSPLASVWRAVLEAMILLTGCTEFHTSDSLVLADIDELGLLSTGESGRTGTAPAWRFLGLAKADAGRPWLDREITILAPAAVAV